MFARLAKVQQLSGQQGVLVGTLRRSLKRALGIVEQTISRADLETQAWYREAKLALGGREDSDA